VSRPCHSSNLLHLPAPSTTGDSAPPWRALAVGAGLGFAIAIGLEILRVTIGSNLHVVVPGQCYRSAQLSPGRLTSVVDRLRIRTVINLRGPNVGEPWYDEECRTLHDLGIRRVDVKLSGYGPPEDGEMKLLIACLERDPGPLLVHCCSGSDRSGFAAALFLLLRTDTSIADARRQLGIRYGHNPFGAASLQGRLLDAYEQWLEQNGKAHSAANLRQWACQVYHYFDWQDRPPS
jgi:Swiss Army Knife protein, DSP-PTPase phosphatase domain